MMAALAPLLCLFKFVLFLALMLLSPRLISFSLRDNAWYEKGCEDFFYYGKDFIFTLSIALKAYHKKSYFGSFLLFMGILALPVAELLLQDEIEQFLFIALVFILKQQRAIFAQFRTEMLMLFNIVVAGTKIFHRFYF